MTDRVVVVLFKSQIGNLCGDGARGVSLTFLVVELLVRIKKKCIGVRKQVSRWILRRNKFFF